MADPSYVEYLRHTYEHKDKFSTEMNHRAVEISRELGQERTQYFEKIALGAGGTVALLVSYVGTHAGKLQPAWLLRTALVTLVLTMIATMARNWRFPVYARANTFRQYLAADLESERAKRDWVVATPSRNPVTMQPNDPELFRAQFAEKETFLSQQIAKCQSDEDSALSQTKWLERIALGLMLAAMSMLVALAWINF